MQQQSAHVLFIIYTMFCHISGQHGDKQTSKYHTFFYVHCIVPREDLKHFKGEVQLKFSVENLFLKFNASFLSWSENKPFRMSNLITIPFSFPSLRHISFSHANIRIFVGGIGKLWEVFENKYLTLTANVTQFITFCRDTCRWNKWPQLSIPHFSNLQCWIFQCFSSA